MQLTDRQLNAIVAWAKKTPEVEAVILYGSRHLGTAKPDSNVNFALVLRKEGYSGKQRTDNYPPNYERWEADLQSAVGLKMHVLSLDPPLGSAVQSYVAKGGTELWRRA